MPNLGQGYIGAVEIGNDGNQILVGSTLYGVCNTPASTKAKVVTLSQFDGLVTGITIQVKFVNGNDLLLTNDSAFTLAVGSTDPYQIKGNCVCGANEVIEFTLEYENSVYYWRSHGGVKIETNNNNIVTKIAGQEVNIATKTYVDNATAGLSGLTGAMHFKGSVSPIPDATAQTTFDTYDSGDVILGPNHKEYVYKKGATAAASEWVELGDESSYILRTEQTTSSVETITANGWDAGATPTLGTAIPADNITNWDAGTASTATVTNGVLRLGNSTVPTLTWDDKSIPNVTSVGSAPTLNHSSVTVVVPITT